MGNFQSGQSGGSGAKISRTVVRNAAYSRSGFNVRERHNERKNECYGNGDIDLSRADLNVHFMRPTNLDGQPFTYEQIFDAMKAGGEISTHGLKQDAHVFDEMIFDVNTEYFEERGGYEYAKRFYAEAYRLAVKEVGGEQFVLSAVLHADERNKEVSERLGRDVFHYHLHVVYIPVVRKELYFKKNNKDPELAGKLKEVITQVSHSKKWPIKTPVEKNGKTYFVNAYSLLQDRFFEHMRAAGFEGFERGERGSTAEHLDTLDYKIQQDTKRLATLDGQVEQTAAQVATAEVQIAQTKAQIATAEAALSTAERTLEKKSAQIAKLDERITVKEKAKATIAEVNAMGHKIPPFPGVHFTDDEAERLKGLAKKGVSVDKRADEQKKQIATLESGARDMNSRLNLLQQDLRAVAVARDAWKENYNRLWGEVKPFIKTIRTEPQKLLTVIQDNGLQKSTNREESL